MAQIGSKKLQWFQRYLPYENGMMAAGTFRNVRCHLDPEKVHPAFTDWMKGALERFRNAGVAATDGKAIKGSRTKTEKPTHIVSAFVSAAGLVIGQAPCADKSNEITAIPGLPELPDIHGCLITVDALGVQRKIEEEITRQQGDYLLQVKANQKFLYQAVKDKMDPFPENAAAHSEADYAKTEDREHGRIEKRECCVYSGCDQMGGAAEKWPGVQFAAVIRTTAKETVKKLFLPTALSEAGQACLQSRCWLRSVLTGAGRISCIGA